MDSSSVLITTAITVGAVHTVTGVDHSLPFVALARARRWSMTRTASLVLACGVAHVLSSVVLGAVGIATGEALASLVAIEEVRGSLAGWLLLGFGLAYASWGWVRSRRGHTHSHLHTHADGTTHAHPHDHHDDHLHPHPHPHPEPSRAALSAWALFIIFGLGPCEPLIPMMMAAHADGGLGAVVGVCVGFGLVTLVTMLGVVLVAFRGLGFVRVPNLERHAHTLAGLAVCFSGIAVAILGL